MFRASATHGLHLRHEQGNKLLLLLAQSSRLWV
jgi:hypothetical protein